VKPGDPDNSYLVQKIEGRASVGGRMPLGEANWRIMRGHNLKLAAERFDPDRDVSEDQQTRWSVLYELTPIQFLQLRLGARFYEGISQNDLQNRRLYFAQLHGSF
jgi:hypothetical protein